MTRPRPAAALVLALSLALLPSPARSSAADLDARNWQLFLDDYALARATGFDRVVHHPRPMGVVIAPDKPWESDGIEPSYFARKADGTFVGFYDAVWWAPGSGSHSYTLDAMEYAGGEWRVAHPPPNLVPDRAQEYVGCKAYATSKDGIHWEKPALGLVAAPTGIEWGKFPLIPSPTGSSKANNLGVPFTLSDLGQYGDVADPARRFAVMMDGRAYFAAELPDFAGDPNWRSKLVDAGGSFSPRGKTLSFWDRQHGEWAAIVQNTTTHWLPTRTIARFSSKDLRHWESELVLAPDPADPHTPECYDEPMMLTPYCSDGVVMGLLSWIHTDRTTPDGGPVMKQAAPYGWPWPLTAENPFVWPWARKGVNEMRISLSRDGGKTWDRTSSREAWIPTGTEQDSYDRLVLVCCPPVRVGDEDWFYTGNWSGDHLSTRANASQSPYYHDRMRRGRIALYVQKHDRYVSLSTGSQVETLITQPFLVEGDTLQLNVDASRGRVRVGIAEYKPVMTGGKKLGQGVPAGGTPSTDPYLMDQNVLSGFTMADCRPIEANGTEQVVEFKNGSSLASIRGRRVVLFVEMLDSDLYGFRVHG